LELIQFAIYIPGLSWAMYNLAYFPAFQERCREEIISVLQEKDLVEW